MENKNGRVTKRSQMSNVYAKKRSNYYEKEGYKYALTISNQFLLERIFAFALDTCVMFLPILLWELLMLMMFSSLLTVAILPIVQWGTVILMLVSIFLFNPLLSMKSGGQTIGKYFFDIKVVQKNRHEASPAMLALREILGFSLPTVVLMFFFNVIGLFVFWIVDFIFLVIHPRHISIIDMFLGTRVVIIRERPKGQEQPIVQPIEEPKKVKSVNAIDLHVHSNFSDDGEYNVEEIFQMASRRGMKCISICDHNTIKGNLIAKRMSSLYHVQYIPGVELDCRYKNLDLRILGYHIDYNSDIFATLENESLKREKAASLKRVELFENFTGIKINVAALMEKNRFQKVTGEMIARQVLHNQFLSEHDMLQPYLVGDKRMNPYKSLAEDFFGKGGPCYVNVRHPKLEDILDIIKLTGGIPVLACAGQVLNEGFVYMDEVLEKGIEGIEVFTPAHTNKQMAALLKIAKEYKLFVTAGSDFHGISKPYLELGVTNCPIEAEKIVKEFSDLR